MITGNSIYGRETYFKDYMGDSVYIQFDGCRNIVLTTENGLPDDPSNTIILEPEVLERIVKYASLIEERIEILRQIKATEKKQHE